MPINEIRSSHRPYSGMYLKFFKNKLISKSANLLKQILNKRLSPRPSSMSLAKNNHFNAYFLSS